MDFQRAWLLLDVADKSLKWPHLKWLHDRAIAELEKLQHSEPSVRRVPSGED